MVGGQTPLSPRDVQKVKKEENKVVGKDTLEKTHIQMEENERLERRNYKRVLNKARKRLLLWSLGDSQLDSIGYAI